ncbi:MAG: hypothetical protein QOE77_3469 [Blastocatellia bacterium]|jgi:hypothetical protein|nr:hypothetical protein [Blastocatellia bacterium]
MRILIDECLDWRLCRALAGHYCSSVQKLGWGGLKNGELLKKAEGLFDVFITGDRNLSFQQSVETLDLAVIVLLAPSTQLRDTVALMPRVLAILPTLKPGQVCDIPK